ncbi:MAG: type II secretion system protein [Candidatus Blackburnbacteria bacterium]|nr:type II secretion system protein [Candidatus Blackburnbacteria bacterium]
MNKPAAKLRGFTLIELLIVIAVIGILATAVLSAINPIEQIRKGTDTGLKSDAAELLNAVERYYTTFQKGPWATLPNGTAMSSSDAGITELVSKNELKTQFQSRTNLTSLIVTENSTSGLTTVCFAPISKTFRANAKYANNTGSSTAGCPKADLSAGCFICLPE